MGTQIDTGLGWSAKSDWLVNSAITLGYFSGGYYWDIEGYEEQEIPVTSPTQADVIAEGFHYLTYESGRPGRVATYRRYIAANKKGAVAAYFHDVGTSPNRMIMYVPDPSFEIYLQQTESGNPQGSLTVLDTPESTTIGGETVYYYYVQGSNNYNTGSLVCEIPMFSYYSTILDCVEAGWPYVAAATATTFYKLNPGYAVGCVAKWYSPGGEELISPVLISNIPANTVISTDGTAPSTDMVTFDFLYQGMRFYMSLIGGNTRDVETLLQYANLLQFGAAAPSKLFLIIVDESVANVQVSDAPDPYGDTATEEGGPGGDIEDDPVDEQTNPLPSVAGLGFCTVYVPSQSELLAMSSYLWSGSFDVTQVIKLFSNPLDSILGLSAVPVDLTGTSEQIYLGGVALTGVTMPKYTGRTAVKVDIGTVTIGERYGAYLDYDPYTEFAIYVPFVGIKNLKADDIMGKTLSLMYDIDILTGACVAYLRPVGGSVLYEWAGQCAQQIPVTSSNWDNMFRNAMTAAATLGTSLLAPASAPVLAGAVASAASQAIAAKPRVDRSGSLSGVSGWLGQLRPYIIRTIPEAYIPADQNKFIGYPAYINVSLGSISGYNEVASIHLEGIPATGNELAEIESLLKGGAIF